MRKIEHRGYTVEQTSNNHIWIGKNGQMVCHAQCDKRLTDDELRGRVDALLKLLSELQDK